MCLKIDTKKIAEQIWGSNNNTIDLKDFIVKEIRKSHTKFSDLEINEQLEIILSKVKLYLERKITECREKQIKPRYEFDEYFPELLIAKIPVNEMKIYEELKEAIREMNWRSFEYLCKHLLDITGAIESGVTRRTKEGGIDLYGLVEYKTSTTFLKGLKIRIVAQAKHKSKNGKVETGEIKQFIQEFNDFKNEKGTAMEVLPEWFRKMNAPCIGFVITNGQFRRPARSYVNQYGIFIKDKEHILEDLLHSPLLNNWYSIDNKGNKFFNKKHFLNTFDKV